MIRPILNLELQGACTGASGSTLDLSLTTVTGLSAAAEYKDSVRLATSAALAACTYNNAAGTLTATANGTLSVDGTAVALSDRLLIKNQGSTFQNGIYKVTTLGTGSVPFVLTRAIDFDIFSEMPGAVVSVETGTSANAGTQLLCNVVAGGTLGTTAITFVAPKNFVDLTTSQTVTGTKTFTTPVLGDATATSINGITLSGGATAGTIDVSLTGGSIETSSNGVNIRTSYYGGDIDTREHGGSISTTGDASNGIYPGGSINTAGGATSLGGNINTSGQGSNYGGSIDTSDGGGNITTRGAGNIELGADGTRTTFTGNASGGNKSIALPNLSGTVALTTDTAIPLVASFF